MKNLKPVKTVMSFNTSSKLVILSTLLSGLRSSIDLATLLFNGVSRRKNAIEIKNLLDA